MRMFIGYFLMGYLLASLKVEKMTDILRMRRFQTLMTSVRVEIRQNLWQVRFVLLRMLWSANLKAGGFLLGFKWEASIKFYSAIMDNMISMETVISLVSRSYFQRIVPRKMGSRVELGCQINFI